LFFILFRYFLFLFLSQEIGIFLLSVPFISFVVVKNHCDFFCCVSLWHSRQEKKESYWNFRRLLYSIITKDHSGHMTVIVPQEVKHFSTGIKFSQNASSLRTKCITANILKLSLLTSFNRVRSEEYISYTSIKARFGRCANHIQLFRMQADVRMPIKRIQ
jgi:hypothetical protein